MSVRTHAFGRLMAAFLTAVGLLVAGCVAPKMEAVDRSPVIPALAESFEQPTKPVVGPNDFSLHWRIWVVNIYTGKIWYAGQGMMPLWSPDGEYLAMEVTRSAGEWGIELVGQGAPSCPAEVGHLPFGYAWGSDGRTIIYDGARPGMGQRSHTLRRVKLGTYSGSSAVRQSNILHDGYWGYNSIGRRVTGVAWGRTGQRHSNFLHSGYNVLDIMRDGTVILCKGCTLFVIKPGADTVLKLCELPANTADQSVEVAPDLSRVAYTVSSQWGQIKKLHIRNLATGQDRECGDGHMPRWSPDSLWVACSHPQRYGPGGDIFALYLVGRNGDHRRIIGPGSANRPDFMDWSPDGTELAYSVSPTYAIRR